MQNTASAINLETIASPVTLNRYYIDAIQPTHHQGLLKLSKAEN